MARRSQPLFRDNRKNGWPFTDPTLLPLCMRLSHAPPWKTNDGVLPLIGRVLCRQTDKLICHGGCVGLKPEEPDGCRDHGAAASPAMSSLETFLSIVDMSWHLDIAEPTLRPINEPTTEAGKAVHTVIARVREAPVQAWFRVPCWYSRKPIMNSAEWARTRQATCTSRSSYREGLPRLRSSQQRETGPKGRLWSPRNPP